MSLNECAMQQLERAEPTRPSWCGTNSAQCHPNFDGWGTKPCKFSITVGLHSLSFHLSGGRQRYVRPKKNPFLSYSGFYTYFAQPLLVFFTIIIINNIVVVLITIIIY